MYDQDRMNRKTKANNENDFEGQLVSKIASTVVSAGADWVLAPVSVLV